MHNLTWLSCGLGHVDRFTKTRILSGIHIPDGASCSMIRSNAFKRIMLQFL